MSEENKALTRRLEEQVWNEGNLEVMDEILAPDFVAHVGGAPAALRGRAAVKEWAALWRTAFPDVHAAVEDVIGEDDKVVTRITLTGTHQGPLMGVPATGKSGKVMAIAINRFADGRLAEIWSIFDMAGLLSQIGVLPSAPPTPDDEAPR